MSLHPSTKEEDDSEQNLVPRATSRLLESSTFCFIDSESGNIAADKGKSMTEGYSVIFGKAVNEWALILVRDEDEEGA